jgi:hypothetical protein
MRAWIVVLAMIMSLPAWAQEQPQVQIFGGYSYLNTPQEFRIDGRALPGMQVVSETGGASQNGWNASIAIRLFKRLDLVADTSSSFQYGGRDIKLDYGSGILYHLQIGAASTTHTFLFGPQVRFPGGKKLHPFGRALFGISRLDRDYKTISSIQTLHGGLTHTGFVFAAGGGIDWRCSKRLSLRVLQADYLRAGKNFTYDWLIFYGNNPVTHDRIANSFRIASGVVFNIGLH